MVDVRSVEAATQSTLKTEGTLTPLAGAGEHVLVVEDDRDIQALLLQMLEGAGYQCASAFDAEEARSLCATRNFQLVLTDVGLPGESGLALAEHVLAEHPDTAAVLVTALDDAELAGRAVDLGAHGFVIKPLSTNEVLFSVRNALQRRRLEVENRAHREALEQIVRARTAALERSAKQMKLSREETVRRLSRAVEYRDEETGGHTERMSAYSALLAGNLGLDVESIRIASPMHDVGKVALPDHLLLRPGALTPDERIEMERHTTIGYQILSGSGSALLELGATIALTHHERWDGAGYPQRLRGSEIPLEGQVAAVADVFDALTSNRPYRKAFSLDEAVRIMNDERGKHFDPRLVDFFVQSIDEIVEIRDRVTPPLVSDRLSPAPVTR
jgi:putative two-component system response regulator